MSMLSLSIGQNGHKVSITKIPPISAPIWKKSASFEKLCITLKNQKQSHPIADLVTALESVLPIEITPALEEATFIQHNVIQESTKIENLKPLNFLSAGGFKINVTDPDVKKCPSGVTYVRLNCYIHSCGVDKSITQPPFDLQFCLMLPQSSRDSTTGVVTLFSPKKTPKASSQSSALFRSSTFTPSPGSTGAIPGTNITTPTRKKQNRFFNQLMQLQLLVQISFRGTVVQIFWIVKRHSLKSLGKEISSCLMLAHEMEIITSLAKIYKSMQSHVCLMF